MVRVNLIKLLSCSENVAQIAQILIFDIEKVIWFWLIAGYIVEMGIWHTFVLVVWLLLNL